jgi:hypothetical protein
MRVLPVILGLLLVAAGVALFHWNREAGDAEQAQIDTARRSVEQLEARVRLEGGMGRVDVNGRGWPTTIDPQWFKGNVPRNPLIPATNPWLEVAPEWQYRMTDPPDRLALSEEVAAFWYNPATGTVRARVSQAVSDERALEVYNEVNRTRLTTLFLPVEARASVISE